MKNKKQEDTSILGFILGIAFLGMAVGFASRNTTPKNKQELKGLSKEFSEILELNKLNIKQLKAKLKACVAAEDYEQAAKIRDVIAIHQKNK